MNAFLIDSRGDLWSSNSRDVRHAYDSPFSGGEFTNYAIKNLGFVGLHEFGSSCHLKLSAEFVTEKALETCFDWIRARPFSRFVLSLQNGGDRMDLFSSFAELFRAIEISVQTGRGAKVGDYLAEPFKQALKPAIVALHDALRENPINLGDQPATAALSKLIKDAFGNRYIVASIERDKPTLAFENIGDDLFASYREWRSRAKGTPVNLLPDPSYGDWVAKSYYRALETQCLFFERVDVIVRWPHAGKIRHRYRRVILPFVGPSGTLQLISGTADDVKIDLRIKTA